MDDIANEIGLSKGSLYRYFKNKKQLFLAILGWLSEPWEDEMQNALAQLDTASDKLRFVVTHMVAVTGQPDMKELASVMLDFYSAMRFDEDVNESLRFHLDYWFDLFARIVEEGIASGEFRDIDARQAGIAIMASTDGMGLYDMMNVRNFDLVAATEVYIDIVLAGLKK
ncbi:MAG: TetR/AcrR family transcriptional regulator [Chloroflexi bacterium]|nr:TetR/AcrR family transcriptional regulator [Chloroflexota bacterium]